MGWKICCAYSIFTNHRLSMKKVLVTGATGFVGSYVVEELLRKGYKVIASSSNKSTASSKEWFTKVTYIEFDLRSFNNDQNCFLYFQQPDMMIHLAWEGLPNYTNKFHLEENLPRHCAFLNNMLENGLKDITITGTCFEYGMQDGCLSEDMEVHPANPYAVAKDELRKYIEALSTKIGFNFKWIRLFYMYGKGQNPKSLISQLDKALENGDAIFNMSGGEQVRDFLPVEKVAEYIVLIALQQKINGIINCCSGNPVIVKDFVEQYVAKKQKAIKLNLGYYPYADYEPMAFWGHNTKLELLLNS